MSEKNNIVQFKKLPDQEQVTGVASLIKSMEDMAFDKMIVLAMKGDDIYIAHSNMPSRLEVLGALSGLQSWLWATGYLSGH